MTFNRFIVPILAACIAVNAQNSTSCPDYCRNTQSSNDTYVCGDPRLGPVRLPSMLPLSSFTDSYRRFGGLCPGEFLSNWYNSTGNSYIYPPIAGFQLATDGTPIQGNMTLARGILIDRFGSEYGAYFAPYGAPFEQRALPPSNLDTPPNDDRFPYNYHVYQVLQPLVVLGGPIAPWFDEPGQGVQYQTYSNVMSLLANGTLRRVSVDELVGPRIPLV